MSTKDTYKVHNEETGYGGIYGSYGFYQFYGLLAQKYTLKYEKQGYETQTKDVDLTDFNPYSTYQVERVALIKLPLTPTPIPTPTTTDGTITGTWKGNYTIPDWSYSTAFTLQLEQNGNDITGYATTSDGCNGTLTGTTEGAIITFEVKGKKSGICCKSKWKGTAIITCSEDYMVMTFTIKDNCNGKAVCSGGLWKQ